MTELYSPAIFMLGELLKNFDYLHSQYGHEPSFDMVMSVEFRSLVTRHHGYSVCVHSNDHPPPHFHVRWKGESVAFSIETGERLDGYYGLKNRDKFIEIIWNIEKHEIAKKWDETRPSVPSNQSFSVPAAWGPAPTEKERRHALIKMKYPNAKIKKCLTEA